MLFPLPEPKVRNIVARFDGIVEIPNKNLAEDPITNQLISSSCWNGWHEKIGDDSWISEQCIADECKCLCHNPPIESSVGSAD